MIKKSQIPKFEKAVDQLGALYKEMSVLSNKRPDSPVNALKVRIINERLREADQFLEGEFRPFNESITFDDSSLPFNSDVVLVLSQYLDRLKAFRNANRGHDLNGFFWRVERGKHYEKDDADEE